MGDNVTIICPNCGERLSYRDEIYMMDAEPVGCSLCIKGRNAQEWFEEMQTI